MDRPQDIPQLGGAEVRAGVNDSIINQSVISCDDKLSMWL